MAQITGFKIRVGYRGAGWMQENAPEEAAKNDWKLGSGKFIITGKRVNI